MARILAHSSPAPGHVLPMIPALQELQARGHDVHLRTDRALLDLVAGAGIPGSPTDPRIAAIALDDGSGKTGRERMHDELWRMLARAPLDYPRRELPPGVVLCGAQSWDPPATAPDWLLEPGDPWVLVSCSTEYQGDEALALTAADALRELPVRVLITAADATDGVGALRRPGLRVERFVPHAAVLPHVAAVVCHGGMGTVQKAVGHGVPLVVVPFGRDQPEVARRVERAGAGVRLPRRRLTPRRLRAAVAEALAMRDRAQAAAVRLAAAGGPHRAADALEELLAERGRVAAPARAAA